MLLNKLILLNKQFLFIFYIEYNYNIVKKISDFKLKRKLKIYSIKNENFNLYKQNLCNIV